MTYKLKVITKSNYYLFHIYDFIIFIENDNENFKNIDYFWMTKVVLLKF